VDPGGVETVSSGAIAIDTTVLSGGVEDLLSGGVASGVIVDSGGMIDRTDATMDSVVVTSLGIANGGDLQSIAYVGWVRRDRTFLIGSTLKTVVGRRARSQAGA
jgi:autotransporter passenger strand-loop-strand repeat protein